MAARVDNFTLICLQQRLDWTFKYGDCEGKGSTRIYPVSDKNNAANVSASEESLDHPHNSSIRSRQAYIWKEADESRKYEWNVVPNNQLGWLCNKKACLFTYSSEEVQLQGGSLLVNVGRVMRWQRDNDVQCWRPTQLSARWSSQTTTRLCFEGRR